MASGNITRQVAAERSSSVTASAYRVSLDVTGARVQDAERHFHSISEIDFTSHGPATHVDIIAEGILGASVDGEDLDSNGFDGYRLALPELADGEHTLVVEALVRYSRSGEGMHRFVDPADDRVYLYSQFEPADARRVFANFEQPDQKATFTFSVVAPSHWEVFSNSAAATGQETDGGASRWDFAPTPVVPSYITAVVAGEYHVVSGEIASVAGTIPATVACRQSMAEHLDADRILATTQRGFEVFEEAFDHGFVFDSYDQIFVPEFNFGAMENAGCVTFRDEYLFRSRVTAREIESRDNTILHELAHMWFGNLVTMRWWDDLWLNESFAEWASHFAADEISRRYGTGANPWTSFSNERKNWAYLQDQMSTTHPIAADMGDLDKVEQNFDGITYAKGASVLKLLVSFVGQEQFLRGVAAYFKKHAYANTTLGDLLAELEAASGRDLSWFTGQWLETAGVNTLRADFDVDDQGRFTRFAVQQSAHPDWPTLRTHRLGIGLYSDVDGELRRQHYVELDIDGETTEVPDLVGLQRGDIVLLNDGDLTYAKVRFDEDSAKALVAGFGRLSDPLARAVTLSNFWDATRDGEIAPQDHVALTLTGFTSEQDMAAASTMLNQAQVCSTRFMAPELRDEANEVLVTGLARLLKGAEPGSDAQLIAAKNLITASRGAAAVELVRGWLDDEEVPEGLVIDAALRWQILTALAALGVVSSDDIAAELEQDNTITGAEKAAAARAALPHPDAKATAWADATSRLDIANETHRQTCMGFWQYHQDDVLAPYVQRYFDVVAGIANGEWNARGFAAVAAVLRWLFPETMLSEDLVEQADAWLAEHDHHEQVRRGIQERIDEGRRALRCQERSRSAVRATA